MKVEVAGFNYMQAVMGNKESSIRSYSDVDNINMVHVNVIKCNNDSFKTTTEHASMRSILYSVCIYKSEC